ncbi:unannotated protein [freshwater metagenome]|uniref:Unannotated protein n=1 Tax=freshwater metagenome TaxID=449393 RepID=A0A6J7F902_9ZZZZ
MVSASQDPAGGEVGNLDVVGDGVATTVAVAVAGGVVGGVGGGVGVVVGSVLMGVFAAGSLVSVVSGAGAAVVLPLCRTGLSRVNALEAITTPRMVPTIAKARRPIMVRRECFVLAALPRCGGGGGTVGSAETCGGGSSLRLSTAGGGGAGTRGGGADAGAADPSLIGAPQRGQNDWLGLTVAAHREQLVAFIRTLRTGSNITERHRISRSSLTLTIRPCPVGEVGTPISIRSTGGRLASALPSQVGRTTVRARHIRRRWCTETARGPNAAELRHPQTTAPAVHDRPAGAARESLGGSTGRDAPGWTDLGGTSPSAAAASADECAVSDTEPAGLVR